MKKLFVWLLAALMALSCLPAMAQEADSEPVTLRWYYAGNEGEGSADVEAAFNKKLAEVMPNTALDIIWVADWATNLPLFMAGGEPMDIIWECWYTPFSQDVDDGNLIALNDLVDQYAPNLKKEWETFTNDYGSAIKNGQLYGIPCVQPVVSDSWALRVNEALYPYFPVDEFIAETRANTKFTEKALELIEQTTQAALDAGVIELGGAWTTNAWAMTQLCLKGYQGMGSNFYADLTAEKPVALHVTELPEYQMVVEHIAKWYDWGWITDAQIMGQAVDGSWTALDYFGGNANWTDLIDERGIKLNVYNEQNQMAILMDNEGTYPVGMNSFGSSSTYQCIPYTCKVPERAIKFLDLLHDEPGTVGNDLMNMLVYGFEASSAEAEEYGWANYTAVEVNGQLQVDTSIRGEAPSKHGMTNWVMGNTYKIMSDGGSTTTAALKTYAQGYYEGAYKNRPVSVLADMPTIDLNEVVAIQESMNAVTTEYAEQLWNGGNGSEKYMALYEAYTAKLQAAGLEEMRTFLQSKVDEHLAK